MNAGIPLEFVAPLRRFTTRSGDTDLRRRPSELGTHTGRFRNCNVLNAVPGFIYWHERKTEADIASMEAEGYEVVDPAIHPERLAGQLAGHRPFGLLQGKNMDGGLSASHELVLMRIHISKLRANAERKARANRAQLEEADRDFKDRGEQLANRIGAQAAPNRGPLYYAVPGHGIGRP